MCGRYLFSVEQHPQLSEMLNQLGGNKNGFQAKEIFPSAEAPVLLWEQEHIKPEVFLWGFPGYSDGKMLINARAETAGKRLAFKDCLKQRRVVIPASGFFEWDKSKQKFLFTMPDKTPLFMAGLWNTFGAEKRFCILTTEANGSVQNIHHRMPLVLPHTQISPWLLGENLEKQLFSVPPALNCEEASIQLRLW